MEKYRFLIFAVIMSFCTSTTVSAVIIFFNVKEGIFLDLWVDRLIVAWPTVFLGILCFVPMINKFLDKFTKN